MREVQFLRILQERCTDQVTDSFRDSLKTDLARHMYDWCPIPKPYVRPEIFEEIIAAFCVREEIKCLRSEHQGQTEPFVEIEAEPSLLLYSRWKQAWYEHGYDAPLLLLL